MDTTKPYQNKRSFLIHSNSQTVVQENKVSQPEILIVDERLNDFEYINLTLVNFNKKLKKDDIIFLNAETQDSRTERIFSKFSKPFACIFYFFDFIVKRVFPKCPLTNNITQYLTKGKNRVMSKAEIFGRIHACGFYVTDHYLQGFNTQIQAKKVKDVNEVPKNVYGIFMYLKRVGYQEKRINVLKLRTMHCYSDFIQEVVYNQNDISPGGKIKNDFRITKWGSFFRKFWIDELPMIYNWIKGDMKFVGVRPLSEHYFGLYPADMQKLRTSCKPGLVPPFYADMPKTLEEVIESERKYLEAYFKSPFRTDMKYFFLAMNNIFFRQVRSS
jgi:lipopolysaccharide/colanic/teichoic acid biosynthesis glycosyltransferase